MLDTSAFDAFERDVEGEQLIRWALDLDWLGASMLPGRGSRRVD